MGKRVGIEVSFAASEAVKLANVDVIASYPITPQTHIVERLSKMVADGELDAEYINVESEHSAISACIGASAVGARTFTATCSQGLALMHEILYIASALRLPIVMAIANRALSAPLNIWGDHSDVMAERDSGWIQVFTENGQEVFDHVLCAFKIAEDKRVMLPVMVNLDGFTLSHVIEPIIVLDQDEVKRFLPDYTPVFRLDPDNPFTMGPVGVPEIYTEAKKQQDNTLRSSEKVIVNVWKEFGDLFGRYYSPIESYRTEDSEILLLTLGSIGETAMNAVDKMRKEGKSVGLLKMRLWRPFPFEEIRKTVKNAETLAVVDRCLSFGGAGGPVFSEMRSALYGRRRPRVVGFVAGLGGRDVRVSDFETMVERAREVKEFEMVGVRE